MLSGALSCRERLQSPVVTLTEHTLEEHYLNSQNLPEKVARKEMYREAEGLKVTPSAGDQAGTQSGPGLEV